MVRNTFSVRVTDVERAQISAAASLAEKPRSAWARRLLLGAADKALGLGAPEERARGARVEPDRQPEEAP